MSIFPRPITNTPTQTRRLIAIAGNPNSGKTTLFNRLTGARHKVGNYPGVTVERKIGQFALPSGEVVDLVDLPGTYSFAARSPEEQISHDVLVGDSVGLKRPDSVIVVLDASNVRRNLYFATQLRDMGVKLIVALNMMDIARERGFHIDPDKLSAAIGCPVIPVVARTGEGISELLAQVEQGVRTDGPAAQVPRFIDALPEPLESTVKELAEGLEQSGLSSKENARGEALWLLVSTLDGDEAIKVSPTQTAMAKRVLNKRKLTTNQVRAIETSARYQYLRNLMVLSSAVEQDLPHRVTEALDRVLLHRLLGPVIFLSVMAFVFQSIFSWAEPAMAASESLIDWIAGSVGAVMPDGLFRNLVVEGAIAGMGNVLIFLPQILLLFFFIGILEDTGYMARAAFLMDRVMAEPFADVTNDSLSAMTLTEVGRRRLPALW